MDFDALLVKHKLRPECSSGVGDGWVPILDELLTDIESLTPIDVYAVVDQIKKFGTLRIYLHTDGWGTRREVQANSIGRIIEHLVRYAELRSHFTCEDCGKPGVRRSGGWILTLCDECHQKERKNMMRESDKLAARAAEGEKSMSNTGYSNYTSPGNRAVTSTKSTDVVTKPAPALKSSASVMPRLLIKDRVLSYIRSCGDFGATTDEIEVALGGAHQTISPRVHELAKDGSIINSGSNRKTRAGRNAIVFICR